MIEAEWRRNKRWIEPPAIAIPPDFSQAIGGHALLAQSLFRRGITDPAAAEKFLDEGSYSLADPSLMPDLDRAVERLQSAIGSGERIGVWGDFDVDGQTSTALLVSGLRRLGGDIIFHVPVRARESHGITLAGLQTFLDRGVQLLLTCDTGINANEAVIHAAGRGVETIISDHHILPPELPQAFAVVNPHRLDPAHPLSPLCGVGTAFQILKQLFVQNNRLAELEPELDLVALGTVADVALLTGDNRCLVQRGIDVLRKCNRLGIQVLLALAEIDPSSLTEEHIGFAIAPRLNAIGRLGDANPAVDFLITSDLQAARLFANQIEGLNARRKMLSQEVFKSALAQVEKDPSLINQPVLVLAHPEWPAGVVGIVASRLVELYQRPVLLIANQTGEAARGSARSLQGIDITRAIGQVANFSPGLLLGFGGHAMAAGFSLPSDRIPEFRRILTRTIAEMTTGGQPVQELKIDAFVNLSEINLDLVKSLERLAPFGPGNPPVTLASRNLTLKSHTLIGKGGEHLRLIVEGPDMNSVPVVWWQGAGLPIPEGRFDLAYQVRATNFRGQRDVQIEYIDVRMLAEKAIEIRKSRREIIDLRSESNLEPILEQYKGSGILIWAEGEAALQIHGTDRFHLLPAETLIIFTIPPGQPELQAAIKKVNPHRVVFLAVQPSPDDLPTFLNRLGGLLKYSLSSRGGRVTLSELAAATGQRFATLEKGIAWYCARGFLAVIDRKGESLQLYEHGSPNPSNLVAIETELSRLLLETAAFRSFYQHCDPKTLID